MCLVSLAAGCGVVRFGELDPPEDGRKVIVDVGIDGNDGIGGGTLTEGLYTYADLYRDPGESLLDLTKMPDDIDRIETTYGRQGYFEARVINYRVIPHSEDSVKVIFTVDEGAGPTSIVALDIEGFDDEEVAGDDEFSQRLRAVRDAVPGVLSFDEGDIWTEEAHEASLAAIEVLLRERGFARGEAVGNVFVDREAREARVVLSVAHGPLVRAGEVRFEGLREVEPDRVMRRVDLEGGEVVTTDRLEEQEEQIFGLEAFFAVSASLDGPTLEERLAGRPETFEVLESLQWPETQDVVIDIQERPLHEIRWRLGVLADSQRAEVYGIAGYENGDLFGGLEQLEVEGGPKLVVLPIFWDSDAEYTVAGEAGTEFVLPSLIEEYIRLSTRFDYELYVQEGAKSHQISVSPRVSRPFLRYFTAEVGYELSWFSYFDVTEAFQTPSAASLGFAFRDKYLISQLIQSLTADFRDNPLDPKEWAYFQVQTAEALSGLGSDFQYFRYVLDGRLYFTFWDPLTIALRTRFGQVIPIGIEVPLSARLKGGGAAGQRGFATGQLGPVSCPNKNADGRIDLLLDAAQCEGSVNDRIFVGGNLLLEASFELRARLPFTLADWPLGLVAFVDMGQIFDEATEFDFDRMEWAVGPGFRWLTDFGPIRFDLGFLLTAPDPPGVEFHFSLGQAF